MRKCRRVCAHLPPASQVLLLRRSQGKMNLGENSREWGPPWVLQEARRASSRRSSRKGTLRSVAPRAIPSGLLLKMVLPESPDSGALRKPPSLSTGGNISCGGVGDISGAHSVPDGAHRVAGRAARQAHRRVTSSDRGLSHARQPHGRCAQTACWGTGGAGGPRCEGQGGGQNSQVRGS